jgi:hypothetical protein
MTLRIFRKIYQKLPISTFQISGLVLLISALGLFINILSIPLYTELFSFEVWGSISLDLVYFNFFLYLGAFAINIYLFHSKGEEEKRKAAKIVFLFWISLLYILVTLFWPKDDILHLTFAKLGLLSSLSIYKSGIEWRHNRFVSQRLWLLIPVLIFHIFMVVERLGIIQDYYINLLLLIIEVIIIAKFINLLIENRKILKKHLKQILSFCVGMMFNLVLTAGVELKMKTILEANLSKNEWSVFSLGLFIYSFHGLLGNNLSPMLNTGLRKYRYNYEEASLVRLFIIIFIGILIFLLGMHLFQHILFKIFNGWYFLYSVSILLWLIANILSVQYLNSKIIAIFGVIQLIGFIFVSKNMNIDYYFIIHFIASFVAFTLAISRFPKEKVIN